MLQFELTIISCRLFLTLNYQTRLVPGSFENIRAGLEWAGLDYDYGSKFILTVDSFLL